MTIELLTKEHHEMVDHEMVEERVAPLKSKIAALNEKKINTKSFLE